MGSRICHVLNADHITYGTITSPGDAKTVLGLLREPCAINTIQDILRTKDQANTMTISMTETLDGPISTGTRMAVTYD